MKRMFYVDTCIWLNIFKKEETSNKKYWKIGLDFIEQIMFSNKDEIIYSGFVLKELKYKLDSESFNERINFFIMRKK